MPHVDATFSNLPKFCDRCGAAIYSACPSCEAPFPSGVLHFTESEYPRAFCRGCGQPLPWATREDIVAHIENVLAENRDVAEGDRRLLIEQLDSLRRSPDDNAVQQRQIRALERLRGAAPKLWEGVLPVLTPILTAELRRALGLPPT